MTGGPVRKALICLAILWVALATPNVGALPLARGPVAAQSDAIAFAKAVDSGHEDTPSVSSELETKALDEMLRGTKGQFQRWAAAPELVVLASVMEYRSSETAEYRATAQELSDVETDALIADLTSALATLTDNTFRNFSAVTRESVAGGTLVRVTRPNRIVVGRFRDVQRQINTIGLGGRAARADGTITAAAILLDADFDRTNAARRLLRVHELGHALGYNHVESRTSIMNPRIGPEFTDFDRRAAALAFQK